MGSTSSYAVSEGSMDDRSCHAAIGGPAEDGASSSRSYVSYRKAES